MTKWIRVAADTYAALEALTTEEDTFDDLIARLVADRRDAIPEGAGLWGDTDAAEEARKARTELKTGTDSY